MAVQFQVTFDCADPHRMAEFWGAALGYKRQDPPEGWESWESWARDQGIPEEEFGAIDAVVDPDGRGPRLLFQRVPEPKKVKNRVHLDVNVGGPYDDRDAARARVIAAAERLEGFGATTQREEDQRGEYWIVMQDPEGNEFCLQ